MDEKDKLSEALRKAAEERQNNIPIKEDLPEVLPKRNIKSHLLQKQAGPKTDIDRRLVVHKSPKSALAEQYRSLMTHILSSSDTANLKTLVITSSSVGEGKTITALNLAIVLAQDLEKRVLVLDCNFRKPAVDTYLGLDPRKGLSDILAKTTLIESVILDTGIRNLSCICAGQGEKNPSELIGSPAMQEVLGNLRARFDYIILDTPAVIPYTDPRLISRICDGVLLVIKAERTRREVVSRAESLLREVGAKLLGVALTDIKYHIPEYIHKHL